MSREFTQHDATDRAGADKQYIHAGCAFLTGGPANAVAKVPIAFMSNSIIAGNITLAFSRTSVQAASLRKLGLAEATVREIESGNAMGLLPWLKA